MNFIVFSLILFLSLFSPLYCANAQSVDHKMSIRFTTKDIPGARAAIAATLRTNPEQTWQALIDFNHQAGKYPRLNQSFCIPFEEVILLEQKKIRKPKSILKETYQKRCDPHVHRNSDDWTIYIYQEIDYPFPIPNKGIVLMVRNYETSAEYHEYSMKGKLVFGNEKVHEIIFQLTPDPENPQQTKLFASMWIAPGGMIMDWMVKYATNKLIPAYIQTLEQEASKIVIEPQIK